MSSSAPSQPAGWYYAQGDPPGTQRYWDGRQWIGDPQAVAGAPAQAAYPAQSYGGAVGYGAVGGYGASAASGLVPAEYGTRVVAYLIDWVVSAGAAIVVLLVAFILGSVARPVGFLVGALGILAVMGFGIWNIYIRQGTTGQSIGKEKQGIKLVADATDAPVGAGMCFIRYLLAGLITSVCLLDLLWPLWDADKKRLTDKILNFSVVRA